jgi:hypothetical protein
VEVDLEGQMLRRLRGPALPGALGKIDMPLRSLCEAGQLLVRNLWRFLRADIHYFAGMKRLFTLFYEAIRRGGPPPVPYAEVRRVTSLMDEIFRRCRAEKPEESAVNCNGHGAPRALASRELRAIP